MPASTSHSVIRATGLIVVTVVLSAISGGAWAQDLPPMAARPDRNLFGNPNPDHQLDVTWSLMGVRDDNVTAGTLGYDPRYQRNGEYGVASTDLEFLTRGGRGSFSADLNANGRYYPDLRELNAVDGRGSVNGTLNFGHGTKTTITVFQQASFQPYFQLNLLGQVAPSVTTSPGSGAAPGNTALATQESHEYDGRFQIAEAFRNGSVLSFEYDYRTTLQAGNPAPFLWRLGNAKYTRKMSRYAAVRLGYGYGQARDGLTAGGAAVINQNLDVGLDYARPLSSSRRTRFSTATGSAIVTDRGVRYYRLMIDSTLTREIGRSWNANINYHRGVQYVEGVAGPIYADTVQARFGGLVTRRLSVKTSAGYSNGDIGLTATRSGYTTYSGTADMRFAISRELSIDVQYVNYHYDFGQGAPVLSGIPSTLSRQGLRVGLAGWLPITR